MIHREIWPLPVCVGAPSLIVISKCLKEPQHCKMSISLKISERARSKAENKAKAEEGKAASGKVPQSPPEGAAR